MYTQCPDCSTAFRVTATVLKQAAGKVRCGGCGHAFNALEYLSETMPDQPAANDVEESLPELKPEPLQDEDVLPASISAEQSAALLKTLDELAGSDIRIEDTGVEWRVLDDDELGDSPVDEILEDSPTPIDQFLTDTPAQIDSPEIFDEDANAPAQTPVDELRFDDDTPLPDDFDFGEESPYTPPLAQELEADESDDESVGEVVAASQPDVDLSEPDEWTDILDEFDDLGAVASLPLDEELAALDEELADEAPAEPEGEALEELESSELEPSELEPSELESSETESTEPESSEPESSEPESTEPESSEPGDEIEADVDSLLDMDTQFALQAEAMGIDLSGVHDTSDEEPVVEDEQGIDELLNASEAQDREIDELLDEELVDEVDLDDIAIEEEPVDEVVNDEAEQLDLIDEAAGEDSVPDEVADDYEPEVPPMSEEEQTINMQIDADLMAMAVEDKEGLASTIRISDGNAQEAALADRANDDEGYAETAEAAAEKVLMDTSAGFETIIMEGEEIRSGLTQEFDNEEDRAAAAALVGAAAAEREAELKAAAAGKRRGLIAGVIVLALVLALQVVHQKRDVLAKTPAFNDVAGPLYRAIGQPLAPEWDITGWRFEATKGSTDDDDQNLTIYSRLGNKLDEPLPYPLIAISLTDRFEETIGSRILDPADYLAKDLDPRKLVEPGNTFNAVMTIAAPDPEATGFKLNVCYRDNGGDLRCAIDDFK